MGEAQQQILRNSPYATIIRRQRHGLLDTQENYNHSIICKFGQLLKLVIYLKPSQSLCSHPS